MNLQSLAIVAFRLLLHLYPKEFRDEYGHELTLAFHDQCSPVNGTRHRLLAIVDAFTGLVLEGCAEQIRIAGRDLKLGWRAIRKDAVGSLIIVATVALAVGANTTMFGIVDRLLLQPLPGVKEPSRLVRVYPNGFWTALTRSWADFLDLKNRCNAFAGVAAYQTDHILLQANTARKVRRDQVTASYFSVLGVGTEVGRLFQEGADANATAPPMAVISHEFWQSEFGGDPTILGRSLRIAGVKHLIVGVADRNFAGVDPNPTLVWTLIGPLTRDRGNYQSVLIIGRIRPGLSTAEADREANRANRAGWQQDGQPLKANVMQLGPLEITQGPSAPKEIRVALWLTLASSAVLLAGLLGITQLLTARALRRSRETAVHLALGASRARLLRQWISESLLLAMLGGAASLLVAYVSMLVVYHSLLPDFTASFTWSAREVALAIGLTLICGVVTGSGVAFAAASGMLGSVAGDLKQTTQPHAAKSPSFRGIMVALQVGLAVVVLVGAVLFSRSLQRVLNLDAGFTLDHLLVVHVDAQATGGMRDLPALHDRLAGRARQLPGIAAAGLIHTVPGESAWRTRFYLSGRDAGRFLEEGGGIVNRLSTFMDPAAMSALQLHLLRGRSFAASDRIGAEPVTIVNERLAKEIWPGAEALGQCLHLLRPNSPCTRVIGVVNNTRVENWFDVPPAQYYIPLAQPLREETPSAILIRTVGSPDQSAAFVQRELQKQVSSLILVEVRPLAADLDPIVRPWKLAAQVLTALGLLTLMITLVAVFGLLAYVVADRASEWAVRQAMGATPVNIGIEVLSAMLRWVAPGIAFGVVLSLMLYQLLSKLLFQIGPADLPSYGTAVLLTAIVTFTAAAVPAWRAARTDVPARLRE